MAITLNGTTGITTPDIDSTGGFDAADLTGTLPALDGSTLTGLNAAELTGTLPAIDGSALTGIDATPTTAQVLSATADASFGEVGTYVFAVEGGLNRPLRTRGITFAGSILRPAALSGNLGLVQTTYHSIQDTSEVYVGGGTNQATLSGTWRLMGETQQYSSGINDNVTGLFLRIS